MRLLLAVAVWGWCWHAVAAEDPFAFTPPADKGMIETPFGPAPAVRDWPKDKPQALANGIKAYDAGDFETAKKWLMPLAEDGNAGAIAFIGWMISKGQGFQSDRKTACDWYERAALDGDRPSQFNLGTCFLIGSGRPHDLSQAARWLWPGAEAEDMQSMYKLAMIYHDMGDKENNIIWLKKLAESGNKDAAFGLYGFGIELPDFTWADYVCVLYSIKTQKPLGYCDE